MLKRKAYSKPLEKQVKFFLSSQKKINALRHRLVICLNVISMFHFNFKVLRCSSSTDITAQETDFLSKSYVSFGFGNIYWRNPEWKTSFFVQCIEWNINLKWVKLGLNVAGTLFHSDYVWFVGRTFIIIFT